MTKQETITPDHATIAHALAAAQMDMGKAAKQGRNSQFGSKYADLGSVMDACMPALNSHGIAVIQPVVETDLGRSVNTVFLHSSGEKLECPVPLIMGKNDMQGLGSAITYARRYGLMSLAGIAPEDDDGNKAAESIRKAPMEKKTWARTIIDELPDEATTREKAKAVADALCAQFNRKRSIGELENEWERRTKDKAIGLIKDNFADIYTEVADAYENKLNAFKEKEAEEERVPA